MNSNRRVCGMVLDQIAGWSRGTMPSVPEYLIDADSALSDALATAIGAKGFEQPTAFGGPSPHGTCFR